MLTVLFQQIQTYKEYCNDGVLGIDFKGCLANTINEANREVFPY